MITFEDTHCFSCGIHFGLDSKFASELRNSHQIFHCPNGHKLLFRETEFQKEEKSLKEQIKQATEEIHIMIDKLDEKDKLITELQSELEQLKPAH